MRNQSFSNTGKLSGFILRLDRFRILIWLVAISFFTLVVPIAFSDLYPTQQDRDAMAETMENPAMIAMVGPGDLGNYTVGAMTAHQMLLLTAVVVGLMNILLMNRHTRSDEEDGRLELIRSLPVGKLANLGGSCIVLTVLNVLLALIVGVGLYALGIDSMNLAGSLLYGFVLGMTGLFFAGLTALVAQITENARNVFGISLALLLVSYLIRAIGDVSNEALSWISPLGWVSAAEVYSENNGWVLLLLLSGAIVLFALAGYLNTIRDLEAGFLRSKPGKKHASARLLSPLGLAFRLQRTGMISWAVAMLLVGVSYGSVMGDLDSFFEGNEMMQQLLVSQEGYSFTEQFVSMLMVVMALIGTVPPVMAMLKLYGEEKKNRLDHLLGRTVSRVRLLAGYLVIAVINGFVMLSLAAVGLWMAAASVMEEPFEFGTIYGAGLAYYPALLVIIGLTVLLIGFVPKVSSLIWLYVLYSFFVLYFGGMFQFPDWVGKLSPFGYIPELPVDEMEWLPVVVLTVIVIGLTIAGILGYRRRDIQGQ
ncbi:ABC-2 type transport system permease protein [Lentibacillus halodurans]|uniref:ABC-2 type transport system permease protein n=1 Tax=Lentibacillus halodurans TaxID=237679 RepID=A0A1I0Y435_9BACI|nr:ABC transporter permease [Lentibacillus halodurans]SFB07188.1 ABC-2 type transport system permease protein [Lentibacillus halodurans]